jgi:hypothetical protein
MKGLASLVILLLLVNISLTTSQLLGGRPSAGTVNDAALAEVDKLFQLASDFQAEMEKAVSQLHPKDEKENKEIKEQLRNRAFHFELYRVRHLQVKASRRVQDLEVFLWVGTVIVDVPTGIFQEYTTGEYKNGTFVGGGYVDKVNYAKLTNIEDEYYALATSLARDLK